MRICCAKARQTGMIDYPNREQYTADDLVRIIAILRDPENGCPWDKVQTHASIRMNFLEEAYEAVDAIDLNDPGLLCEELGDVLMLTGVGEVFPFMRIHTLLEALQPYFSDVPILVMYPGEFDGRHVKLFNRLTPNDYYRAFNVID